MAGGVRLGSPRRADLDLRRKVQHAASSGVYCLNGFWGARLIVEEFIKEKNILVAPVISAKGERPTCLVERRTRSQGRATRASSSRTSSARRDHSPRSKRTPARGCSTSCGMKVGDRGAPRDRSLNPGTRRRVRPAEHPHEYPGPVDQHVGSAEAPKAPGSTMEDPKALVFLMACDSATSDLDQLTDTMGTFVTAGAGAVVGAEVKVNTSEVHDFITGVFGAFGRGSSLG